MEFCGGVEELVGFWWRSGFFCGLWIFTRWQHAAEVQRLSSLPFAILAACSKMPILLYSHIMARNNIDKQQQIITLQPTLMSLGLAWSLPYLWGGCLRCRQTPSAEATARAQCAWTTMIMADNIEHFQIVCRCRRHLGTLFCFAVVDSTKFAVETHLLSAIWTSGDIFF